MLGSVPRSRRQALLWQAKKAGRETSMVVPAYSTMDCGKCGARAKHRLPLSQRTFVCEECGHVAPRDRNSADGVQIQGFIALPSFIAVNGDYNWLITRIHGLTTIALGLVLVAGIIRIVLNCDPFDLSGAKPAEDSAPARQRSAEQPSLVSRP